jgi:hypothetical protein
MPQMGEMEDRAAPLARAAVPAPPPVMAGTNSNVVTTTVDFALAPK